MPVPGIKLDRPGIFRAHTVDRKLGASKNAGVAQLFETYILWFELVGQEWRDISAQGLACEAYHNLEKSDGTLNTRTIDKLKEAYGWDGVDPAELEAPVADDHMVKLTCEPDTYDGKTKIRVAWIDAWDSVGGGGGGKPMDSNHRANFASKLRANAGGVPATPPRPAGRPAAVAAKPATPKPAAAASKPADEIPF